MNRVLYQFPLSHYCEKARWLLDFKDLEYSVKNLFPATHRLLTLWKANSTTVPLVKDGKENQISAKHSVRQIDKKYSDQNRNRRNSSGKHRGGDRDRDSKNKHDDKSSFKKNDRFDKKDFKQKKSSSSRAAHQKNSVS